MKPVKNKVKQQKGRVSYADALQVIRHRLELAELRREKMLELNEDARREARQDDDVPRCY
jgi:hypothetical protein